ncbi:unnamed protein product [Ilex paraguariensis]|uniref:Transmembrane protein n=1 Tax=Ilex paraguariensis TaxID=185542 RepID=A0ABC8SK56_9AQUA
MNYPGKPSVFVSSPLPRIPYLDFPKCPHRRYYHRTISNSLRRHHRRRLLSKKPNPINPSSPLPSNQNLQYVINLENIPNKTSLYIEKFISLSNETYKDLQTLITIDADHRVMISCRRSTVRFLGSLIICGFLIVFAFRVLIELGLGLKNRFGYGHSGNVIRRRDRSLGGKEVVVGIKQNKKNEFKVLKNPLSSTRGNVGEISETMPKNWGRNWGRRMEEKLPKWWPGSVPGPGLDGMVDKEEYQRMANQLIRVD